MASIKQKVKIVKKTTKTKQKVRKSKQKRCSGCGRYL